jgi:hypothetical protein
MELKEKLGIWLVKRFGNINKASVELDIQSIRLYQYIKGENAPGAPLLIKLCEFGCDMNWLLSDKDELPNEKLLAEIEALRKENGELKKELKNREKKIVDAVREVMKKR